MAASNGYAPGSTGGGGTASAVGTDEDTGYWTLAQCKEAFSDYTGQKREEQKEAKEARRYRHGSQYTSAQINAFNGRKQPVVKFNYEGKKFDSIVGFVERFKQDPKAYPRNAEDQDAADLATAVIRYVCDDQNWSSITPLAAESAVTDGIGGIELDLVPTGKQDAQGNADYDVKMRVVGDGFFYDPASVQHDFSDATYMGVSRWMAVARAKKQYPQYAKEIEAAGDESGSSGDELSLDSDRDNKWFSFSGRRKFIRLIELYYLHEADWCWSLFTGSKILAEGKSPFVDDQGETIPRYLMYSAAVDHDGDRYGYHRNLKDVQDEINARRSKGLHILNSRRIIGEIGAFDDVEKARIEAARPDGFVLRNKGFEATFDDAAKQMELAGQFQFLENALQEINNFGPSQVLVGQGVENQSGRAINLRQQAAVAELGPFVLSLRAWKIRVYRVIFAMCQKYWTAEHKVRVTDNEALMQHIKVNAVQQDPMTGETQNVNRLAELDVDIILDEGPDTINAMADTYETLSTVLPAIANMLTPQKAAAALDILIETSALPAEAKKRFRQAEQQAQQPNPMLEQAKQLELAKTQAEVQQKTADAGLKDAQRQKTLIEAQLAPQEAQQDQAWLADAERTRLQKLALAQHAAGVKERDRQVNAGERAADRQRDYEFRRADIDENERGRQVDMFGAAQDREFQARQADLDRQAEDRRQAQKDLQGAVPT